jgi:hypothetical protein
MVQQIQVMVVLEEVPLPFSHPLLAASFKWVETADLVWLSFNIWHNSDFCVDLKQ